MGAFVSKRVPRVRPWQPATILWGRLAACGRVVLGLHTFGCGPAALWGSHSWLQPAFSRRPQEPPERRLRARLPAPLAFPPGPRVATIAAAAALALLFAASLHAATIAEVMEHLRSARQTAAFQVEGRLVRVDAQGRRTSYRLSWKGKSFADTIKVLWEVTDPAPARLKVLIETPAKGRPTIRLAKAADREAAELPPERWGQPLLDSELAYEDLTDAHLFWPRQTLVAEENYGARSCYKIRSEPGANEPSGYAAVTSWIDKEIYFPVFMEKLVKRSGAKKEFLFSGLRESKGLWGARQMEVRIAGEPMRTLLIITRGSANPNLTDTDFDPRALGVN